MRLPKRCAETRPPTPRSRDRLRLWLSQCCILRSSISIDAIDARTDDMKTIFLYKTKQNKTSLCSISSPQPGHIYTTINQYIQSLYNQSNKITNSSKFDTERERERENYILCSYWIHRATRQYDRDERDDMQSATSMPAYADLALWTSCAVHHPFLRRQHTQTTVRVHHKNNNHNNAMRRIEPKK